MALAERGAPPRRTSTCERVEPLEAKRVFQLVSLLAREHLGDRGREGLVSKDVGGERPGRGVDELDDVAAREDRVDLLARVQLRLVRHAPVVHVHIVELRSHTEQ